MKAIQDLVKSMANDKSFSLFWAEAFCYSCSQVQMHFSLTSAGQAKNMSGLHQPVRYSIYRYRKLI